MKTNIKAYIQKPVLIVFFSIILSLLQSNNLIAMSIGEDDKLRVALVSAAHSRSYEADYAMRLLRNHLEDNYPIEVVLINSQEGTEAFLNLDKLSTVDVAVFHVRRKTPSEEDLAIIRDFFNSGKGVIALRCSSHAWENWPDFDQEVLGAKYNFSFSAGNQRAPSLESFHLSDHPIFTGVTEFYTDQYAYQYLDLADDVNVIMEGKIDEHATPVAWTREYKGGKIFHLVPGGINLMKDPSYVKMITNAIHWVTNQEIPESK